MDLNIFIVIVSTQQDLGQFMNKISNHRFLILKKFLTFSLSIKQMQFYITRFQYLTKTIQQFKRVIKKTSIFYNIDPKNIQIIKMQSYVNLVKGLVQTGQQYINQMRPASKKQAMKIDKSQTLYEARCFNDSQLQPIKCAKVIKNLIYHFNKGQTFTQQQTNFLFFGITKLFFSDDPILRRSVYMMVKQMTNQPSIYIVTSSLMKDIHHKNTNFRRNSLRIIPQVIDPTNIVQVQRYIKSLLNDPDASVSSGALISGLQMFYTNQQMIKKWGTQIIEKLNSKDQYVQYHALLLIGQTKKKDIASLKKILFNLMKQDLRGVAAVQHLRMLRQISKDIDYDSPEVKDFVNFINRQVRNTNDTVVMQAAKLGCQSPLLSNKDLVQIINILQPHLTTQSTIKKYSVLKIFHTILKTQSRKNLLLNVKQIQKVLQDNNTSLSSIAASILLRICSQNYLQKLFGKIQKTMSEMSIDYKIDVVKSLVGVLKNYPAKYTAVNAFLLELLKKQRAYQIKSEIIKVFAYEIEELGGAARKDCLKQLSKYLSAATYEKIHFQILGIISRQVTKQDVNSDLIKNIICQIYLQEGSVRACGLSTLIKISKFAQKNQALKKTIKKFQSDSSEQVKARLKVLKQPKIERLSKYQLDLIENYLNFNCQQIQKSNDANILSIDSMKKWGQQVGPSLIKAAKKSNKHVEAQKSQQQEWLRYKDIFANHSTFKSYGPLRKINKPIHITDPDSQFQTWVRIFLFDENFVIQYKIQNRFPSTILQNVKIQLKHSDESFQIQHIIAAKQINSGQVGQCYVGLKKIQDCEQLLPEEKISSIAKYTVKQMSGEQVKTSYQDQFALQDYEIKLASYMSPWIIDSEDYAKTWQSIKGQQQKGTFQLKYASTQAAQQQLIKHYGMKVIDVPSDQNKNNMVNISLAGKYLGKHDALIILLLAYDTKMGCLLKIRAKSDNDELSEELIASIS